MSLTVQKTPNLGELEHREKEIIQENEKKRLSPSEKNNGFGDNFDDFMKSQGIFHEAKRRAKKDENSQ